MEIVTRRTMENEQFRKTELLRKLLSSMENASKRKQQRPQPSISDVVAAISAP